MHTYFSGPVKRSSLVAMLSCCLMQPGMALAGGFVDPLDLPAETVGGALAPDRQPLVALARAGERIVAAGFRGLIIVSDDRGATWQQAAVPVQTDLAALSFASASRGWAGGHDGVILHTEDGGLTWSRQLDFRIVREAFPDFYRARSERGLPDSESHLEEVLANSQGDAALPYLSLAFDDDGVGYAVGTFGMIALTRDGGEHWEPGVHLIDNPHQINLNAIRRIDGRFYIAAEEGIVFRFDEASGRFLAVETGHAGSFFEIVGNGDVLLAVGLRGGAYRSTDGGLSWEAVPTGIGVSLHSGVVTDFPDILLFAEDGRVLSSAGGSESFSALDEGAGAHVAAAIALDGDAIVTAGYGGVQVWLIPGRYTGSGRGAQW